MKEMKREKHASYSSHNSCKSLSEELRDYYEGRHRSHLRPHSHRREKERKPQEANIKLSYFHGKDNVEANLDWEIRVEQQLKNKSTSKSYSSHFYPKKDQGQGILGVTPSKPKDDKGKTIEKQAPKASMQEKTSSIKCLKCLGRGHITSQCSTTKTMIMRGQDIYSSQDEATTSPSSSESEKAKGEESSEEIYPQEEGQPLVVKEKCKEVSVSSESLAKKETHFTIKTSIEETFPLRQPPHFLFCKKALARIATPLGLEFIPQVKKLLDEGLVRKSLNPCALLVPKIGQILSKVEGMMQSYSARALGRRLQVDWARDPRKDPRVLMSLRLVLFECCFAWMLWKLGRIDGDPVLRETRIWATWEYVSSVGGGQQGMSGTWRYVAGVRRPWGRQIVMAAQLIHDRVEMECLEGAWETLEGNTRCRFRGTIRFTATSLVHPDEPARTLQRTVEWILPTPTPYRLVEPVQVIEVTSSEEDPEEDPKELPPEPAVDALDFLEGDEDPLPEVDSPEEVMLASEADSTEDGGPGKMAISGGSSS
ncbi:hypothetical protein HKD37_12G034368 [Glycine soja]